MKKGDISMNTIIIFLIVIAVAIAVIVWYVQLHSTGKDIISTYFT